MSATATVRSTWREMAATYAALLGCALVGLAAAGTTGALLTIGAWIIGAVTIGTLVRWMGRRA